MNLTIGLVVVLGLHAATRASRTGPHRRRIGATRARLLLYHQTAMHGRGGIPSWWFGAPIIAFVYTFFTATLVPDLVP